MSFNCCLWFYFLEFGNFICDLNFIESLSLKNLEVVCKSLELSYGKRKRRPLFSIFIFCSNIFVREKWRKKWTGMLLLTLLLLDEEVDIIFIIFLTFEESILFLLISLFFFLYIFWLTFLSPFLTAFIFQEAINNKMKIENGSKNIPVRNRMPVLFV